MRYSIILIFSLFIINCTISKGQNDISGIVLDSESNLPLQYSHISIENTELGILTNEKGLFNLKIDSNLISNNLIVSFVGYKSKIISTNDLKLTDSIFLTKYATLPNVSIVRKKENTINYINKYRKTNKSDSGVCNWISKNFQVAAKFKGKHEGNRVKNISFFMTKKRKKETSFRLRIYGFNAGNNSYYDLLSESLIISNNKKGWVQIDLTEYNVIITKDDFLVSYEWLDNSNRNDEKDFAQCIGLYLSEDNCNTYSKREGGKWTKLDHFKEGNKSYNLMVKIELD